MTNDRARLVPSKRLKNWHRRHGAGRPLKAYARALMAEQGPNSPIVRRWFANKAGAS